MVNTDVFEKEFHDIFSFGNSAAMADELLALVLSGKKSAIISVALPGEEEPAEGNESLVLDGQARPACIIRTTYLSTVRFCDLTWDMVKLEGVEGNFKQWKKENKNYWIKDGKRRGYTFSEEMPMNFEQFEVIKVYDRY